MVAALMIYNLENSGCSLDFIIDAMAAFNTSSLWSMTMLIRAWKKKIL